MLATAKANKGGAWDDHIQKVVESYNDNPRAVVHGSPNDATNADLPQNFLISQDNAARFQQNFEVAKARAKRLEDDGAFRPAISDGSRAHKPRYGPVENLDRIEPGGLHVISEDGTKRLAKTVLSVPRGSEEPGTVFGTRAKPPPRERAEGEAPRARPSRPMTGPIPEAASRAFEPPPARSAPASSSSAPAVSQSVPAFANPRSAGLAAMFSGDGPKRTPEEHARIKAEAARKKQEADDKRRAKDAARRQKERDEEDRREARAAARKKK
jgi:hypothetical protein